MLHTSFYTEYDLTRMLFQTVPRTVVGFSWPLHSPLVAIFIFQNSLLAKILRHDSRASDKSLKLVLGTSSGVASVRWSGLYRTGYTRAGKGVWHTPY